MTQFFRPSDINTLICTVTNKTKGGSAFAICPDEEQVFISPKIVDAMKLDVGDMLTAYSVDNYLTPEGRERYSVRWRAIRISVRERFMPMLINLPAVIPQPPVAQKVNESDRVRELIRTGGARAWTANQIGDRLGIDAGHVAATLSLEHANGKVAMLKVYSKGGQSRASHSYYGRDTTVLRDIIEGSNRD